VKNVLKVMVIVMVMMVGLQADKIVDSSKTKVSKTKKQTTKDVKKQSTEEETTEKNWQTLHNSIFENCMTSDVINYLFEDDQESAVATCGCVGMTVAPIYSNDKVFKVLTAMDDTRDEDVEMAFEDLVIASTGSCIQTVKILGDLKLRELPSTTIDITSLLNEGEK